MRILPPLLMAVLISSFVQAQTSTSVIIRAEDCSGYWAPKVLLKGEILHSECDSLYLLSADRYRLYSEAVALILNIDTMGIIAEMRRLEDYFKNIATYGGDLQSDYDALEKSYERTLQMQEKSLSQLKGDLSASVYALEKERERLNIVQAELSKAQKSAGRKNLYWGAGGLAAGFLTAFLVMN